MNDQDQRANTEKSHEFPAPQTRKKIWDFIKKHFVITGITTSLISGFIFYGILLIPGYAWAAYHADTNTIRAVQLMLTLKGYDLSYGDYKGIDGKLGSVTREAIIDYQKKKTQPLTGTVNKGLYDSLYEDTKSKLPLLNKEPDQPKTDGDQTINTLSGELNATKEDLKNTKDKLDTLRNDMGYHFITNFRDLTGLLASMLAILTGIIIFLGSYWINQVKKDYDDYRQKILNDAEKKHQEMLAQSDCLLSANLYSTFSAHCIDLYKDFEVTNKSNTRQRTLYNSYLKIAKALSNRGYVAAKRLEILKPELTDNDKATIAYSINNKLFYSATPAIEEDRLDKKEIRRLYMELEKIYNNNDNQNIDKISFMETMTWADLNSGNYTNLSEIENIIQPLLNNKRHSYELRKDIFERYKKYRTPQGDKLKLNEPPKDS